MAKKQRKLDECPHCKKSGCVKYVVERNVETYGNNIFHLKCVHCGEMIRVSAARVVVISSVTKSDRPKDEADF